MDFAQMMKQAQIVQQKLHEADAKTSESTATGSSGGGLVTLELKGSGEMTVLNIDESLLAPGEGEVLSDLIRAAYGEARRKLEELNRQYLQEAAGELGPLGGIPKMPKFF
ncbi:hypothetical protein ABI_23630 [Asticcacaulis biprosthecium C19]|uniref:Nucleoid-associated protein ABI_23630 n=2 Tax=Asticcacaulis biprosthecium TaxID=76891 RepID=F4QNP3_9CAUL|nr:YbaB/EbfC family nucleoid-associated protein [Asticcacaulis biprosthecium]EGF90951.1 hypothetical protein ABI_23630 [Asticcacaulis biprosthecium C19]